MHEEVEIEWCGVVWLAVDFLNQWCAGFIVCECVSE